METSDNIFNNSANFFYRFGQVLFLESYYLNFGEIGKSKRKNFGEIGNFDVLNFGEIGILTIFVL